MRDNNRRRGNMSLHYSLIAFIVLVIFVILSLTVFFNVEYIDIVGSSIYSAEEIVAATKIQGGDNMLRTNMGKAEAAVSEELIYIEKAEIHRKLPSGLEIVITPCAETASLQAEEGYFVVSAEGKILRMAEAPVEDTLLFIGAEPAEEMQVGMKFASADDDKTEVIYKLMEKSEGDFASGITSFDVTDRLNISCMYEDRINVEIKSIADIDYKFRLAEEIIKEKISPDAEGRLKMLDNGAQFLSNEDLENINQFYEDSISTSGATETMPPETESTDAVQETVSTRLNFE